MATTDTVRAYRRRTYGFPDVDTGLRSFLIDELTSLEQSLRSVREALIALDTTATTLGNYANDAAAAAGGVPLNGLYHTAGDVKVRLV